MVLKLENKSRSHSELFADKLDSRWPIGGHFEFSKMGGDVIQLLPIFEGVRAIDHFMVYIESRHPQLSSIILFVARTLSICHFHLAAVQEAVVSS